MPRQPRIRHFLKRRAGLFLNFAPWCKFCAVSSDNLTRLRRLRDEDSLEILTVALDWQDRDEVRNYVDRRDLGYSSQFGLWWRTWFVD